MRSKFAIATILVVLSIGAWPITPVSESELSLSLSASRTSPQSGQSVTLTARANNDVEATQSGFYIYDTTADKIVATCPNGTTCTASVTETDTHAYVAGVGDFAGTGIEAQSSNVLVTWPQQLNWSISLSASSTNPQSWQSVTLTAQTIPDVGETPWWLYVYDVSTGNNVATCRSGTSCTASVSGSDYHSYVARVGVFAGNDTQAQSSSVVVTWQQPLNWNVSLAASDTNPQFGQNVTLTAQTNNDVEATPWRLYIYNITVDKNVATCQSGTACATSVSETDTHAYVARVGAFAGTDTQAQSSSVAVIWQPQLNWSVSLAASAASPLANQPVTLTANANQDVGPTKWGLQIYDTNSGAAVQNCDSGTICTIQVSAPGGAGRTYGARIGKFDGTETQVKSSPVTVNWASLPSSSDNISLPRPVPSFYQNYKDSKGYWGAKLLGFNTDSRYDIGRYGCTITSLADLFNYYQTGLTDPGKLNDALVALGRNVVFLDGGGYLGSWDNLNKLPASAKPTGVTFRALGGPSDTNTVDQELRAGRPVLAFVMYGPVGGQNTHFVVISGKKNGRYTMSDPAYGRSDQTLQDLGYTVYSFVYFNGPSR
ncbi:MAG: C39 family peptidase [Dehalococcoidia bacterium]|nr:C39 family peptidase [Dehalococcoidia bacterium]